MKRWVDGQTMQLNESGHGQTGARTDVFIDDTTYEKQAT